MGGVTLKRSISLPLLVFYGVGTMVGGGFYALLGEISGAAGRATPLALLLAGGLAFLAACSFAELGSRFPVSAGEARYVQEGFGRAALGALVGWLVIATGIVSAATLAVATVGFLLDLSPALPSLPTTVVLVLFLGAVAAWGIGESALVVSVITVIEVAALLYALGLNAAPLADLPARAGELLPGEAATAGWTGVFTGAFLAFYAFIGFEDMVNVAEEVRDVRRTLPVAILVSLGITTLLYVVVATAAVLSVPPERLAGSATPVAELVRSAGPAAILGVQLVSILTGVNGALVQIIMASRVAYGLAEQNKAPQVFGRVARTTRTPVVATASATVVVMGLAAFLPLTSLANVTSGIILAVFALVNLALWRIKRTDPGSGGAWVRFPAWLPLFAFAATTTMLALKIWQAVNA